MSAINIRYSSLGVVWFKSHKSIQNLSLLFFLIKGTMLASHLMFLAVRMKPTQRSYSISSLIFVMISASILLAGCLYDLNPSLIDTWCSTSFWSSLDNSWYSQSKKSLNSMSSSTSWSWCSCNNNWLIYVGRFSYLRPRLTSNNGSERKARGKICRGRANFF